MIEKPIMFSAPMVLAVLERRKFKTRRLAKARSLNSLLRGQPDDPQEKRWGHFGEPWTDGYILDHSNHDWLMQDAAHRPGEGMWVRENFRLDVAYDGNKPSEMSERAAVWAEAGGPGSLTGGGVPGKLRPSIHMPRWASRIDLLCTGARVERLHDITEEDAIAEGLIWVPVLEAWRAVDSPNWPTFTNPIRSYAGLWVHLHGRESWDANPLVWVYSFELKKAPT